MQELTYYGVDVVCAPIFTDISQEDIHLKREISVQLCSYIERHIDLYVSSRLTFSPVFHKIDAYFEISDILNKHRIGESKFSFNKTIYNEIDAVQYIKNNYNKVVVIGSWKED